MTPLADSLPPSLVAYELTRDLEKYDVLTRNVRRTHSNSTTYAIDTVRRIRIRPFVLVYSETQTQRETHRSNSFDSFDFHSMSIRNSFDVRSIHSILSIRSISVASFVGSTPPLGGGECGRVPVRYLCPRRTHTYEALTSYGRRRSIIFILYRRTNIEDNVVVDRRVHRVTLGLDNTAPDTIKIYKYRL